jgi:hypothetical protein
MAYHPGGGGNSGAPLKSHFKVLPMYSCFISYCHGQQELTQKFIDQLTRAVKSYLEPFLDEEVYIDTERLKPGYQHTEKIAEAICRSLCMIVVYSPRYEKHMYCLREFEAMREVEKKRLEILGKQAMRGKRLIIPIIFRTRIDGEIPAELRKTNTYCDFSKFTTASSDISQNAEYVAEIEKIARTIVEHYNALEDAGCDISSTCNEFELPDEENIVVWKKPSHPNQRRFPGRGL